MNQRTRSLLLDCLIALALSIILALGTQYTANFIIGNYSALTLLPLIWLALRFGPPTAIVLATITGIIIGIVQLGFSSWLTQVVEYILPLLFAGIAGLFAKYTQKTLNNRRYSSTYLNIVTAVALSTLVFMLTKFFLAPIALGEISGLQITSMEFWLSYVILVVVMSVILIVMARSNPKLIIPKRTKYLSRKETSSLLND
ncbi:energy-coupled thiamine transporter ThiT [Aerococcaceae bacterium WGS1372]